MAKKKQSCYGKKSRRRSKLRHCGKFHFVRQFEMLVLAAANALDSSKEAAHMLLLKAVFANASLSLCPELVPYFQIQLCCRK